MTMQRSTNTSRPTATNTPTGPNPASKGYVIYATSDSLIQEVNKFIAANPSIETDSIGPVLRGAFPRNIKIERVLLPKRQKQCGGLPAGFERNFLIFPANAVGNIFYNISGTRDRPARRSRRCTRRSDGGLSERTRKKWVEELRKRYPVKINKKNSEKVKPLQ